MLYRIVGGFTDLDIFNIDNFNVVEDDNFYYVFRALNIADSDDIINTFLETGEDAKRIRTDRERYEEQHGRAKYNADSELSLEEITDHIKIHYLKETNCISFSTNANVCLDYGSGYRDQYVPKPLPEEVVHAGDYMIFEIFLAIEEALHNYDLDENIRNIINNIDAAKSNNEIKDIIINLCDCLDYPIDVFSRFNDKQFFDKDQQLNYNKIIGKATALEIFGVLPSILPNLKNSTLLSTVGGAFSSGEVVHYKDVSSDKYRIVSKQLMMLFAITQQLKDKYPNDNSIRSLELKLIDLYNNGYDVKELDGRVVLTNGKDVFECNILSNDSTIFNSKQLDEKLLSLDSLYDMADGSIDYNKAVKTVKFCYSLATARKEAKDYAKLVLALTNDSALADKIANETLAVNSEFIDRGNNHGYRLCESVNIGMNNDGDNFYSLSNQKQFVNLILKMSDDEIEHITNSNGVVFRDSFIGKLKTKKSLSKNEYFAKAIVNSINFDRLYNSISKNNDNESKKDKLIGGLKEHNIVRLYHAFEKIKLNHTEISYYIINLFLEKSFKGYSFDELCNLEDIDTYIKNNFSVFNRDVNIVTLDNFMGVFNNKNFVPDSYISLRDFQQRIKEDVDDIYNGGKRFAGIVLPTGGGKSFITMAEMLQRKDKKIVYIAPRLEILRQFKKNIVEYIAGCNPEGLSDRELDVIAKSCFPHLELVCYQGLSRKEEEDLANLNADFIIFDEIHHIGSETWNPVVKKLLDNNPKSQVLGISATPQRDEYEEYEADGYFDMYGGDMMMAMAAYLDNYSQTELYQKKYLACDINIIDAIQEGYVVCPTIVSFDYNLDETEEYTKAIKLADKMSDPVAKKQASLEVDRILDLVSSAKLEGVDELIEEHLKVKDGKYILFIPRKPLDYEGTTDEYIEEYLEQFRKDISNIDSDPHIDYIHSKRGKEYNERAMKNFELDTSDHIKVLVAIDMLNEGVHLPNLSGSFNFRKIDNKHLILLLQHLGRVIFALDPDKELTDDEIPIVFDKFNNYSNLDLDRLVNKKSTISDLEKLKNIIFWIEKYGRMPSIESNDIDEQRKVITLGRLKEKYAKFRDKNFNTSNLNDYEQFNISEIIDIFDDYDFWNYEIVKVDKEKQRKIDRVNIFKVSAIRRSFIDACNSVYTIANTSDMSTKDRLEQLMKVLDILAENNILITPDLISEDTKLFHILDMVDPDILADVNYELRRIGINEKYPLGIEYYFGRINLKSSLSIFKRYDYTFEEITNLRKYGLLCNGEDIKFIDDNGFIIAGPEKLLSRNIWTGTYYSKDRLTIDGYDCHGFNYSTKVHRITNDKYDPYGFDMNCINRDTNTKYDRHGFDIDHIHKDTNTKYNPDGFDIDEIYHPFDKEKKVYEEKSTRKYDNKGLNIDGYDVNGFDVNSIHIKTGQPYDELYFDKYGFYYESTEDGSRRKTNRRFNDDFYDRQGNFYEKNENGEYVKSRSYYNRYGFKSDGLHYITKTFLDPRGFDINGIWYRKGPNGIYINTGSIFNDEGWTIDKKTLRTEKISGKKYFDFVNDYGFDYKHRYHKPEARIDSYGFVDYPEINIKYSDKVFRRPYRNGVFYDIHDFDENGNNFITGTYLDSANFDRDGYWWKIGEDGVLRNTHSKVNDEGWTIDRKYIVRLPDGNLGYSTINEFGFDADHMYRKLPNRRGTSSYDEFGFDFYGINNVTGTNLNEEGFDRRGIWHRKEKNGSYVCTNSKYNDEGWAVNHVHEKTKRIVDEHGFNYLHLYVSRTRFKTEKYSKYDKHNFDYQGINKVTGTHLNRNGFDIDGNWWTTDKNGVLHNTHSKYDDKGLNIDRYSVHDFNSKGTHRKTHRKINQTGFLSNGINVYTNELYDLNGFDIDGNRVSNVDWNLIRKINEERVFNERIYIEDYIESYINSGRIYDIIESFDEFSESFDYDFTGFLDIVNDIINSCVTKDERLYTKKEVEDYLRHLVLLILKNGNRSGEYSKDLARCSLEMMEEYRYDGDYSNNSMKR